MNNNMETNIPAKKSYSAAIITILVVIVVALVAYLAYDKVIKKDEVKDDKESGEVLSDEEALKVGNELFEYTWTFAYDFAGDLVKFPTSDGEFSSDLELVYLDEENGSGYEITNYDEIMSHFAKGCKKVYWDYQDSNTKEEEMACEEALPLVTKNGKHYTIDMSRGGNTSFIKMSDLKIKSKEPEKIEFSIDYSYCIGDTQTEDIASENSKCYVLDENDEVTDKLVDPTTYTKNFIIVKEDGSWKIQKYYNDNA